MYKKIALAFLVLVGAAGRWSPSPADPRQDRASEEGLECFVSILPQAFLVETVGGEMVRVRVMVGPGQAPHTYEPTARQLADLAGARLYFSVGVAFEEALLPRVRSNFPAVKIIDTTAGIRKRRMSEETGKSGVGTDNDADYGKPETGAPADKHGEYDPHVWLSPRLGEQMANDIREALAAVDPDHASSYDRNFQSLRTQLDSVDAEIKRILGPYKGREIVVFHPAFGYFTDAYGLVQVAIEENGAAPGPKHMAEVIDRAREMGIRSVFVQPQVSMTFAQTVASAIGGEVVTLDPLAEDYPGNLLVIAHKIAASFEKAK
jgi:zinc transport system substrate-binding protein